MPRNRGLMAMAGGEQRGCRCNYDDDLRLSSGLYSRCYRPELAVIAASPRPHLPMESQGEHQGQQGGCQRNAPLMRLTL